MVASRFVKPSCNMARREPCLDACGGYGVGQHDLSFFLAEGIASQVEVLPSGCPCMARLVSLAFWIQSS